MFIDKDSLIINDINMGKYATNVQYGYNKLWSSNSGRNLAGTQSGTLVGIFPKIIVTFKKLSRAELEYIAPVLDSPSQTVQYYDPYKKQMIYMSTYTGDWTVDNKGMISKRQNESFSISFIARSKRS